MSTGLVRVAVDALADRPERTFTYSLPRALGRVAPGSLVLVPYGRRLALGYLVASGAEAPDGGELREVEAVVSGPMLTPDLLDLAADVAAYYRAPVGTTLASMLPPGLESRLTRRWQVVDAEALPHEVRGLAGDDGHIEDAALLRHAPRRGREAWLEKLRRGGAVRAAWTLRPPEIAERRVRVLRPAGKPGAPPKRAPLQAALLAAVAAGERTFPELAEALSVDVGRLLAPARRLEALGRAELDWRVEVRDPLAHRERRAPLAFDLAAEQQDAVAAIAALVPGGELLLEGVTASGKTEVYLAALAATLAAGRSAILLVPELSGVAQLVDRVTAVAGDVVAALHSGLSGGERHDAWWRILRGEARVVVGTRSAVMAPLADLGLVVIDEAHDGAYKSDRTPRLDARWAARRRALLTGARLVLGTATPDVVTVSRARGGMVERVRLRERRVGAAPSVEVVDLREELAGGNRSIFSGRLAEALDALEPGQQAILLINRRGAATFVLCRDCGESVRCPDCDLPYVFHLSGGRLRCHHCGRTAAPPDACPRCGSRRIRYFGAGTQRVEAELRSRFSRLRIGRLDSDVLAAGRGYETVYDDFAAGAFDVLVGTQLAAKGLDLPTVVLSAVIAADITLNLPDYLAPERTFQLLAQVAGRAGRGPMPGRVIIQSYAPTHYAVRAAAAMDVDAFADEELPRRRLLGYPPASVLARLLVADADRDRAEARGREAAEAVSQPGVEALGPLPAYVPRRAGRWRMQVVLRAESEAARAAALERVPAGVAIDVDPESLL